MTVHEVTIGEMTVVKMTVSIIVYEMTRDGVPLCEVTVHDGSRLSMR